MLRIGFNGAWVTPQYHNSLKFTRALMVFFHLNLGLVSGLFGSDIPVKGERTRTDVVCSNLRLEVCLKCKRRSLDTLLTYRRHMLQWTGETKRKRYENIMHVHRQTISQSVSAFFMCGQTSEGFPFSPFSFFSSVLNMEAGPYVSKSTCFFVGRTSLLPFPSQTTVMKQRNEMYVRKHRPGLPYLSSIQAGHLP